MGLNESTVEDATLEWSCLRVATHRQIRLRPVRQAQGPRQGDGRQVGALYFAHSAGSGLRRARLSNSVGHGATFAKLRRAKPHLPQSRTLATLRDPAVAGLPKLLSGELSPHTS